MAVTQYIGARYVPIFADPVEWSDTKSYEPLTIVTHEGASYTSRQFVPVGVPLTDADFWVLTGNYNAQVEAYRQEVANYVDDIETVANALPLSAFGDVTVKDYVDSSVESLGADIGAVIASLDESVVKHCSNVAELVSLEPQIGNVYLTEGFRSENDGGSNLYVITEGTADGFASFECANGLIAQMMATDAYITPERLGAHGDGTHDDSNVLKYMISNNIPIMLKKRYRINDSILKNSTATDIIIRIKGANNNRVWYTNPIDGCIVVSDGVSVFSDSNVYGCIENIAVTCDGTNSEGINNNTQYLFNQCGLYNVRVMNSYFLGFEAVFLNSHGNSNTIISNNRFISCYYFAKVTDANTPYYFNDSAIVQNYISGGMKYTDNSCFQWRYMQNSIISQNFIDLYCHIYDPTAKNLVANMWFTLNSSENRYNLFAYFIFPGATPRIGGYFVSSVGDIFQSTLRTHPNPTIQAHISGYATYTAGSYTLENYILRPIAQEDKVHISFRDVRIGARGINKFIEATQVALDTLTEQSQIEIFFDFIYTEDFGVNNLVIDQSRSNNGISWYGDNSEVLKTNYVVTLSEAPAFVSGLIQPYVEGVTYVYGGMKMKATKHKVGGTWKYGMIDSAGTVQYGE